MQQWCRAAAFGGETKKNAGTVICCWDLLGNPWSLQDGRVEVDPNPAAPARYIPMVNPEVKTGRQWRKPRHEENGRRFHITKKMV